MEDIQVDPEEDNRLVGEDSRADLVEGNHLVGEGNQAAWCIVVVAADVFGSQVGMGIVEEDIEVDRGSSVVGC